MLVNPKIPEEYKIVLDFALLLVRKLGEDFNKVFEDYEKPKLEPTA
jgi:hypothetical protein